MNADISRSESAFICVHLRLFCLGLVTRDLRWVLSTLYRTHRRYGALFVRRNCGDVLLFNLAQQRVTKIRIGLVPVEAREILLQPWLLEYLAVPRVDLLAHLARVFDEQTIEQRARDRLRAQLLVKLVLILDDRFDVEVVVPGKLFGFEVLGRRVPRLRAEVLL